MAHIVVETFWSSGSDPRRIILPAIRKMAKSHDLSSPFIVGGVSIKGKLWWAKLLVNPDQVEKWLKLSGNNGFFFRPFFLRDSSPEFIVKWMKLAATVDASLCSKIWAQTAHVDGLCGLVLGNQDLGVRCRKSKEVSLRDVDAILSDVAHKPRSESPPPRWWKVVNIPGQDLWKVEESIRRTGLVPVGDVRKVRQGASKWKCFFRASGSPVVTPGVIQVVEADPPKSGGPPKKNSRGPVAQEKKQAKPTQQQQQQFKPSQQEPSISSSPSPMVIDVISLEEIKELKDEIALLKSELEELKEKQKQKDRLSEQEAIPSVDMAELAALRNEVTELQKDNINLKSSYDVVSNLILEFKDFRKTVERKFGSFGLLIDLHQKDLTKGSNVSEALKTTIDEVATASAALKTTVNEVAMKVQNVSDDHSELHEEFWKLMSELPADEEAIIGEKQIRAIITEMIQDQKKFHHDFPLPSAPASRGRGRAGR